MNRSTNARVLGYYAVALAVVVGAVVIGLVVSAKSADAAAWQPRIASCTTHAGADALAPGTTRTAVQRKTGPGVRVWTDTLTYGMEYAACAPGATFVVVYDRATDKVLSTVYAT